MINAQRHPLTLAVAMALGLGTSQVVPAAEFTVTNTDDNGTGSLRWAVGEAASSGDASNTIVFDAAVTGTITLNSDIFYGNSNSLIIQGPGPDVLTVEQDGWVFYLGSNAASVAISGLTLSHTPGSTTAFSVMNSYAQALSLDNIRFRGESPNVMVYGGGCLYSYQWTNVAGETRELSIANSEFSNCRTDESIYGGGLFARQSALYGGDLSVTIENTQFTGGFSGGSAAAYIRQGTSGLNQTSHSVTIDGLVATDNSIPLQNGEHRGYGMLTIQQDRDSSLDVNNVLLEDNVGPLINFYNSTDSTTSIRNVTLAANESIGNRLARFSSFGSNVDIELVGLQIAQDNSAGSGLGISMNGGSGKSLSLRDSLIHDSNFENFVATAFIDDAGYGGNTVDIVNTTITGNQSGGSTLNLQSPSGSDIATHLRHVTITDNTLGGGLQPQQERGLGPRAMVSIFASGERRISNSIIHGASTSEPVLEGQRGLIGSPDLLVDGNVTIDHSLIGTVDPSTTVVDASPGSSFIDDGTDPALEPLADNGGLLLTRALTGDSPAFDAGNPALAEQPEFDQRSIGFLRASGAAPDMGAFELQVPRITVAPDIDFGDLTVGATSADQFITLGNDGDGDLEITGFTPAVSAPFALDFSDCGAALPFTVAPGTDCELALSFSPSAAGPADATITVESDSPDASNSDFSLSGNGVVPGLAFEALDFGDQLVGQATQDDIVLTNTGEGDLDIDNISLGAVRGSAVFTLLGNDCDSLVAPGDSCSVTLGFTPPSEGAFDEVVVVESNAGSEPAQVPVAGRGVIGELSLSPSGDIGFGDVALGESGQADLALTNTGSAPLTIEEWTDLPEPFGISGECPEPPFTLQPDESCTLVITFSPGDPGDYEQLLELGFDDGTGAGSTQVAVSGRGSAPVEARPVPTLDRIGLVLGSGLLALMGLMGLRRRRATGD